MVANRTLVHHLLASGAQNTLVGKQFRYYEVYDCLIFTNTFRKFYFRVKD